MLTGFSVMADELIMKDGSRLMGKVLKEDDGVVDFETSYAGTIKVKWSEIREVDCRRADDGAAEEQGNTRGDERQKYRGRCGACR